MSKEISRKEFLEKYDGMHLTFYRYYKYTFTFRGTDDDGTVVHVSRGGNADDIYRDDVMYDSVAFIDASCEWEWNKGTAYKDGAEIERFYYY